MPKDTEPTAWEIAEANLMRASRELEKKAERGLLKTRREGDEKEREKPGDLINRRLLDEKLARDARITIGKNWASPDREDPEVYADVVEGQDIPDDMEEVDEKTARPQLDLSDFHPTKTDEAPLTQVQQQTTAMQEQLGQMQQSQAANEATVTALPGKAEEHGQIVEQHADLLDQHAARHDEHAARLDANEAQTAEHAQALQQFGQNVQVSEQNSQQTDERIKAVEEGLTNISKAMGDADKGQLDVGKQLQDAARASQQATDGQAALATQLKAMSAFVDQLSSGLSEIQRLVQGVNEKQEKLTDENRTQLEEVMGVLQEMLGSHQSAEATKEVKEQTRAAEAKKKEKQAPQKKAEELPPQEGAAPTEPPAPDAQAAPPETEQPPQEEEPLGESTELHPIRLAEALEAKYGPEWLTWDPETLAVTLDQEAGGPDEALLSVAFAVQALLTHDRGENDPQAFPALVFGLNGAVPEENDADPPSAGQIAFALSVMRSLPELSLSEEVKAYIASALFTSQLVFAPPPFCGEDEIQAYLDDGAIPKITHTEACVQEHLDRLTAKLGEQVIPWQEVARAYGEHIDVPIEKAILDPSHPIDGQVLHLLAVRDYVALKNGQNPDIDQEPPPHAQQPNPEPAPPPVA